MSPDIEPDTENPQEKAQNGLTNWLAESDIIGCNRVRGWLGLR